MFRRLRDILRTILEAPPPTLEQMTGPAVLTGDFFAYRRAAAGIPDRSPRLLYQAILLPGERLSLPVELEGIGWVEESPGVVPGSTVVQVWL